MKIGKLLRSYTIEPLQDPVPTAPPAPAEKTPRAATGNSVEEQSTRP
jgi:hypothetical protein